MDYKKMTRDQLRAEVKSRNDGRAKDARIPRAETKVGLITALLDDDHRAEVASWGRDTRANVIGLEPLPPGDVVSDGFDGQPEVLADMMAADGPDETDLDIVDSIPVDGVIRYFDRQSGDEVGPDGLPFEAVAELAACGGVSTETAAEVVHNVAAAFNVDDALPDPKVPPAVPVRPLVPLKATTSPDNAVKRVQGLLQRAKSMDNQGKPTRAREFRRRAAKLMARPVTEFTR